MLASASPTSPIDSCRVTVSRAERPRAWTPANSAARFCRIRAKRRDRSPRENRRARRPTQRSFHGESSCIFSPLPAARSSVAIERVELSASASDPTGLRIPPSSGETPTTQTRIPARAMIGFNCDPFVLPCDAQAVRIPRRMRFQIDEPIRSTVSSLKFQHLPLSFASNAVVVSDSAWCTISTADLPTLSFTTCSMRSAGRGYAFVAPPISSPRTISRAGRRSSCPNAPRRRGFVRNSELPALIDEFIDRRHPLLIPRHRLQHESIRVLLAPLSPPREQERDRSPDACL